MKNIEVNKDIKLVKYYPNYKVSLKWYQEKDVCKQVDNKDRVYDLELLKSMYHYLNEKGELFYIKYKNRLCGDVCLLDDQSVAIVICKEYQNKHIGRAVIKRLVLLAKEKGFNSLNAEIYSFNKQSQKMFESVGFIKVDKEQYVLKL